MNDEPPQLPLDEKEPDDMDDTQLPEMETYFVDPKEFLYHHLTTNPEWEARPMP